MLTMTMPTTVIVAVSAMTVPVPVFVSAVAMPVTAVLTMTVPISVTAMTPCPMAVTGMMLMFTMVPTAGTLTRVFVTPAVFVVRVPVATSMAHLNDMVTLLARMG